MLEAEASLLTDMHGNLYVTVSLINRGDAPAVSVQILHAMLGLASPTTNTPIQMDVIPAGCAVSAYLMFPRSSGASGSLTSLRISGAHEAGSFCSAIPVVLP